MSQRRSTAKHYDQWVMFAFHYYLAFVWLISSGNIASFRSGGVDPEQVHISIGEDGVSSLVITWVTERATAIPTVMFGLGQTLSNSATGHSTMFVDGGDAHRRMFIHRVMLAALKPEQTYGYVCGSADGWSEPMQFRTLPQHSSWSPRLAIYGDLGVLNNRAFPELKREVEEKDNFDVILHVGDFAYDLHSDDAKLGDSFMRMIQPIAARVPYMTAVGNHEEAYNFSNYKARFNMPGGDRESQFYSFDIGPVHVIAFSSEFYYFLKYGNQQVAIQYNWIKADLEEANKLQNRRLRPWIIAMGHRPMYCSNNDDTEHCDIIDNLVRTGFPTGIQGQHAFGLEELFYDYGVDIILGAHEHSYERFWPVYNRMVCNGSLGAPYRDPKAPIHIVTGSAGSSEGFDPFTAGGQPWTAFRIDSYGFTRMHIHNSTHITAEQISVDKPGGPGIIDTFTIFKSNHGPGLYTCHLANKPDVIQWDQMTPAKHMEFLSMEPSAQ